MSIDLLVKLRDTINEEIERLTPPNLRTVQSYNPENIKNTLIYTHLIKKEENEEYISKVATTIEEGRAYIEAGFQYVCDIQGAQLFKKRK